MYLRKYCGNLALFAQDDEESTETAWTLKHQFSAQVGRSAITITDKNYEWILYGDCTNIVAVNKIYPATSSIEFSMVTVSPGMLCMLLQNE